MTRRLTTLSFLSLVASSTAFAGFYHGVENATSKEPTKKKVEQPLFYESPCPMEIDLSLGMDDFRGIYSGSFNDSFGALTALNLTFPFQHYFTMQFAGSYGLYDWSGRSSTPYKNSKSLEQQAFVTAAINWLTPSTSGWHAGAAFDWMWTRNFGLFAVNPDVDQVRAQLGYLFRGGNEIGAWATYGLHSDREKSQHISLKFKAISQVNLFYCHYFKNNGYGMLWGGVPYKRGLKYTSGPAGRFIVGAQFSIPLTHSLSLDGHGSYMDPRGGSGITPSKNYGANIYFGLTYAYGKRRVIKNPYMNLANNSNFMVDTNQNF